jgi:predicted DCC family thiol-disulfide oxidoreductase YuxK
MTGNNETCGWVFYDADCALCARAAARVEQLLARRGFRLLPLQTPGAAERLGVTAEALLARMHLLTADGRRFAGADAFVEIGRLLWWARPIVAAARLPAVLPLLRRCYDWIAAHRHCFGGACRTACTGDEAATLSTPPHLQCPARRRIKRVFFEMP